MRLAHFSAFAPVCPLCRSSGRQPVLELQRIYEEQDGHILQGVILCPDCRREYPILDGLPLLLADLRSYVAQALPVLMQRDDLAPELAGLLHDAAGPGSVADGIRQHLSSYGWDHYGDFDPAESHDPDLRPGAVARCLEQGLALLPAPSQGLSLDLGCGPGRSTFALAERAPGLVLGVDLSFPLISLAGGVLHQGRVRYPRRRLGLVYDQREFALSPPGAHRTDFWVCDLQALPFSKGCCGLVSALNLIDCLPNPAQGLAAIAALLAPGGQAVLATPYDWSGNVTPAENWLGGHSQRGSHHGAAEPVLRHLLESPDCGLRLTAEQEEVPWQVRLHDRAAMRYRCHLVTAIKEEAP